MTEMSRYVFAFVIYLMTVDQPQGHGGDKVGFYFKWQFIELWF